MEQAQARMAKEAERLGEQPLEDVKEEVEKKGDEASSKELETIAQSSSLEAVTPLNLQSEFQAAAVQSETTENKPAKVQSPAQSNPPQTPAPLFDEDQLRAFAQLQSQAAWLYARPHSGFMPSLQRPVSLEAEERDSMLRRVNLLQEKLEAEQAEKAEFKKEVQDMMEENRKLRGRLKNLEDRVHQGTSPFATPDGKLIPRAQKKWTPRRLRDPQRRLQRRVLTLVIQHMEGTPRRL